MLTMRIFLVATLAQGVLAQTSGQSCGFDDCTLECNQKGTCCFGNAEFQSAAYGAHPTYADGTPFALHQKISHDGMHCICEDAWTGLNCDHSVEFCDAGKNPCYHNGTCVSATIQSSFESIHVCDCREAKQNGIMYVGLHCEQPTPQHHPAGQDAVIGAEMCDEGNFCLNGGKCKLDSTATLEVCACATGYSGPHCEFANTISEDQCTLRCLNSGKCQLGYRSSTAAEEEYDSNFEVNDISHYQHCKCPNGWSGLHCERDFEVCVGKKDTKHCYHGGHCVQKTDGDAACDCSTATNFTHNFAGSSCEVPSTEFCTRLPVRGAHFCANQGSCNAEGNGIYNCTCAAGFRGDQCEFSASAPKLPEHVECKTKCLNGGKCREGAKDHGVLKDLKGLDHLVDKTYNQHFEHCACPTGFAGLHCEIKAEVCPKGKHVCFHGSRCVQTGTDHMCDCGSTTTPTAGAFCEHKATSLCKGTSTAAHSAFCVNHGSCQPNGKCKCPAGFRGDHCHIVEQDNDDQFRSDDHVLPDGYQSQNDVPGYIYGIIVGVVAFLIIIVTVVVTYKSQKEMDTGAPNSPSPEDYTRGTSLASELQSGSVGSVTDLPGVGGSATMSSSFDDANLGDEQEFT